MRRSKLSIQILWVGLITILLTIFASLILPLVRERSLRREAVLADMTRIWGQPHLISGPLAYGRGGNVALEKLSIEGELKSSMRKKGIFRIPFYNATLRYRTVLAGNARQIVVLSRSRLAISGASVGTHKIRFVEKLESGTYFYRAEADGEAGDELSFAVQCEGLQSLSFLPANAYTEVQLKSDWSDPGFFGDYLPSQYETGKAGFAAQWKIHLPRFQGPEEKYLQLTPQSAAHDNEESAAVRRVEARATLPGVTGLGSFGVNFYQPVDIYLSTERSVKYAILFIALTFLTLVLFETISSAEIHPMQYLLAGTALVIFYLLLLALAEFTGFAIAYAIAAGATVLLLARYSGSFLLNRRHSFAFASVLVLLYGLLYVILQLDELALIAGAVTLFVALAATMYLTRRLDWYRLGDAAKPAEKGLLEL